jgi:hypothetical protein
LRDNFVIGAPFRKSALAATCGDGLTTLPLPVYELFDEVMDFGYPQFTEAKIMSDYIKTDAHKADVHEVKQSTAVTNAVSWRSEGLKYKVRACLQLPHARTVTLTGARRGSEKRGVLGRHREYEPAGEQQRPGCAQRGDGRAEDAVLPKRHAGVQAGAE